MINSIPRASARAFPLQKAQADACAIIVVSSVISSGLSALVTIYS